jgi:tetratricopeptide (TPR) repeat protein
MTSALAQVDSGHLAVQRAPAQPLISVNQLITPEKAQRATEQAREAYLLGHFEQAEKLAKRALDISPNCASALTVEGLLKMQEGKDQKAVQFFQAATHADPALGVAYLAMGEVYNSQGRFKEALVTLDRAAIFLPGIWSVYYETARAHLGVEDFQSSLTEIAFGERFAGGDSHARAALSLLRGVANLHSERIYPGETIPKTRQLAVIRKDPTPHMQ